MNIKLIVVGKTTQDFVLSGVNQYISRLKHYTTFSIEHLNDIKNNKNLTDTQIKKLEGDKIIACLQKNKVLNRSDSIIILLDEHGKEYTSVEFASYIEKQMIASIQNLVFVVGGTFGFSDEIKQQFNNKLSLSQMTFSHQMIRLLFVEQLYRAFTIIKKEPYHKV